MSEIRNLTRNGETFYPLTTTSAVINEATGEGLVIDDKPTARSNNLVYSNGIIIELYRLFKEACYIDFSINGYLDNSGNIIASNSFKATNFIEVEEGEVYKYSGRFHDTALRGVVYGYATINDTNPVALVVPRSQAYVDYVFTIPSDVKYIRAWSSASVTYNLYLSTSVEARLDTLSDLQSIVGNKTDKTMHQLALTKNLISKDNGLRDTTDYGATNGVLQCRLWCLDANYTSEVEVGIVFIGRVGTSDTVCFYFKYNNAERQLSKTSAPVEGKQTFIFEDITCGSINHVYAVLTVDFNILTTYARAEADQVFTVMRSTKDNMFQYYFNDILNKNETEELVNTAIQTEIYKNISDFRLIDNSPAAFTGIIYLANNVQAENDGVIIALKFIAFNTKPFDIYTASKQSTNRFTATRKITITPSSAQGLQEVSINLPISAGEFLFFGQDGTENQSFPGFTSNSDVIAANGGGWYRSSTVPVVGQTFTANFDTGAVNATFRIAEYKYQEAHDKPQAVYITATRNTANFNSIREIIDSIEDASENKQYVIVVPNGEWFECDLKGKKWVTIKGESKQGTIIYCDGTSDKLTPNDYIFENYRGVALNAVPSNQKHIFYLREDVSLENITLRANDCKYTVHFEHNGWTNAKFVNCIFEGYNLLALLGFGLRGVQSCEIDYCTFKKIDGQNDVLAIYSHNWTWEETTNKGMPLYSGGAKIHVKNSKYLNSGNIWNIGEIASMNTDKLIIENCDISGAAKNVFFFVEKNNGVPYAKDLNGNTITNPLDVPYCMQLMVIKSSGDLINVSQTDRPDYLFEVIN